MVNDYTIYDEIGRASNNRAFQSFYRSRSSHVFSQCLSLISGAYMLEVNKHARWIQLYKCISIQYFIHFWHGIWVLANFSRLAALGTPNAPLLWVHNIQRLSAAKKCSSKMVWHFIGVNIINRTLHGRLEIRNSLLVLKNQRTSEIFFNTRRKISYLLAAMYYPLYTLFL